MSEGASSHTSTTLLEKVRDASDVQAWEEFVRRYRPKICLWCRQWGIQEADADDVAQVVLAKLTTALRAFEYDPTRSFRAWLKTVTRHAWSDFTDERRRSGTVGQDETRFASLEAREDLEQRLAQLYDQELLQAAMAQVRTRVESRTWDAFHLTALEGLAGTEVAKRLGMPVAGVFVAKHRVQKMLREEVRRLGGEDAGWGGHRDPGSRPQ